MKAKKSGKTYVDILKRSMDLFNDYGIESVSIFRVAESLGISAGNLTYHFKKKKDLVGELLNRLEEELITTFKDFPYLSSAESFAHAYAEVFRTSWKYRGLFNSAPYLIQSGLVRGSRYRALSAHIINAIVTRTKQLIDRGFMEKILPPYSVHMLVDCIWWQWMGWLRVNQLLDRDEHIAPDDIVASAINHCILLTRPYMKNKDFATKLYQAVQKLRSKPVKELRRSRKGPQR